MQFMTLHNSKHESWWGWGQGKAPGTVPSTVTQCLLQSASDPSGVAAAPAGLRKQTPLRVGSGLAAASPDHETQSTLLYCGPDGLLKPFPER